MFCWIIFISDPKLPLNTNPTVKETPSAEHPMEVIGRIRNLSDRKDKPISVLQVNQDRQSLRLRTDIGYRDFSLDGVSSSEEENLDGVSSFVELRIHGVKMRDRVTTYFVKWKDNEDGRRR